MIKCFIFPTPLDSVCVLRSDSHGEVVTAKSDTHPTGRPGQSFDVPGSVVNSVGANLTIEHPDYTPFSGRGILVWDDEPNPLAYLLMDDFHLVHLTTNPVPVPVPVPPISNRHPLAVLQELAIFHDLTTKEGCGKYTEAAVTELRKDSTAYGHIAKTPPQNEYNHHAVDAFTLEHTYMLADGTFVEEGVYDIITDSESLNAKPAFNRAGTHLPGYYPA